MQNTGLGTLLAIITAIVSVAVIAVIVSQKANTAAILQALATGTSDVIGAAVSPVTEGGNR